VRHVQTVIESRRRSIWLAFVSTVVFVVIADALTKSLVSRTLGPDSDRHSIDILSPLLELSYGENSGIAFGFLEGNSVLVWVLVLLAVAGTALLVRSLMPAANGALAVAIGLIVAGGLANLIDRIADGHVVDFVEIWRWPSFNVADAAITIGVIALFLTLIKQESAR
jgi:signal peptidase II